MDRLTAVTRCVELRRRFLKKLWDNNCFCNIATCLIIKCPLLTLTRSFSVELCVVRSRRDIHVLVSRIIRLSFVTFVLCFATLLLVSLLYVQYLVCIWTVNCELRAFCVAKLCYTTIFYLPFSSLKKKWSKMFPSFHRHYENKIFSANKSVLHCIHWLDIIES